MRDGQAALTAIPVVKNFGAFHQVSSKNNYEYGFSMEFDGEQEYTEYNEHPNHVKFVEERWNTEVESFLEIDFTAIT